MLAPPAPVNQIPQPIVLNKVVTPSTSTPVAAPASLVPAEVLTAAARGLKVFPVPHGSKVPTIKWGTSELASSSLDQIQRWGIRWGVTNWGLATGERSGQFVVDTDSFAGWMWAVAKGLSDTYTVKTGGGTPEKVLYGYHFYFKQPAGIKVKNLTSLAPGVDVRGDGGYVLMPPSLTDHPYSVVNDREPAEAPEWLIELVKAQERTERPAVDLSDLRELSGDERAIGTAIFSKACEKYAALPDESPMNSELNNLSLLAGTMVAGGVFEREYAEGKIIDAATANGYLAHDGIRTVKGTMKSGLDAGLLKEPWLPPVYRAGFGDSPLPAGASLEPPPPPLIAMGTSGTMLTPEERMLANLATQHSIALIFAKRLNGKMLYDHTRKVWMEYDGTRWKMDELKRVHNFILSIASEMNKQNKASMVTSSFCDGVNRHLQSFPEFSRTSKEFDQDHYLLNTPAGTLDLHNGKMKPHDPGDMITLCTAASPQVEGDGATFRKFMTEITAGNEELMRFHQVSLGACLSGAVEDHWLLFWYGVPRAGKNTLGELVEALMGDYARTIPTSTLMSKKFEGHPTEMANLQGIRLAASSELSDGDHWNEARIKQFTGDATLSARWIGGNFFEFERTFKLLVYGNYRPQLRSADEALRARLKIVPFNVSFRGREDKDLAGRLRAEMGYVLQWLIDGHQQWLDAGKKLPTCAAVEAEISHYFEGQSTPKLWLKECCEILKSDDRPDLQLHTVVECYKNYKNWKEARGESPLSQTRWQPEALQGIETVRTRRGLSVRRLRLLPLQHGDLPFPLSPTPPIAVTEAPNDNETFEEFAARIMKEFSEKIM